jgi:hypothetical protein
MPTCLLACLPICSFRRILLYHSTSDLCVLVREFAHIMRIVRVEKGLAQMIFHMYDNYFDLDRTVRIIDCIMKMCGFNIT